MESLPNDSYGYSELHCLSNFTFLKGASHPEELVIEAKQLGYRALAITDECSLCGIVRAHVAAKQRQIPLLIGSEFYLNEGQHFVAIAPNRTAYGQLSSLISQARRRGEKGQYDLSISDIKNRLYDCLLILLPSTPSHLNTHKTIDTLSLYDELLSRIHIPKHNIWVGLSRLMTNRSHLDNHLAYQLASKHDLNVTACGGAYMHRSERKTLQDTLTAIRLNTTVKQLGTHIEANHERHLRSIKELRILYSPEELRQTQQITERCQFSLDELRYEYPREVVPPKMTATEYLKHLVAHGKKKRWPKGVSEHVNDQINKELNIIRELNYEYYFLTVYDIVQFARDNNILCQGRGSAANSAVCFCLFITEVDPAQHKLLFERFISKERDEPPDIDVDFEHERREEVIQFIYKKYGRQRTALAATVITYRPRSAIRDVGKALGLEQAIIDRISQSMAWWEHRSELIQRLKEENIAVETQLIQCLITLVNEIMRFPRHLSQHVGGFIIARHALDQMVPIENASMPDRTVIQWDKDDIEALGLLKVDVLALGMLSAIRKSFDLIQQHRQRSLSMACIEPDDKETYRMLQAGDSIGVFQVESRAQMSMLPRLKPKTFYDLVVEVAIVRPGPIQGNMVHPYLRRRQGLEPVTYPSPEVESVLKRTLGVPIFQEQVIELAMVAAGFEPGEADQLRRSMASWRRKGELERYQQKLRTGLKERGYTESFTEQIIEQINGFGEYGFPESHAASFALLVYVSAWLKRHEPAAFYCALLNSQPMGFYSPSQLLQDAQRHGITALPVDVNHSQWDHTLHKRPATKEHTIQKQNKEKPREKHTNNSTEKSTEQEILDIRLGFRIIKNVSQSGAERIVSAREDRAFQSLDDLVHRTHLNQRDIDALSHADALRSLCGHRYQARWQALGVEDKRPLFAYTEDAITSKPSNPTVTPAAPLTPAPVPTPSESQNVIEDYASTGLSLGRHPMALLRHQAQLRRCKRASDLKDLNHGRFVQIAGLVTCRQRPHTASGVLFLTLEDESGNSNIVVWPSLLTRYRKVLLTAKLLHVKGVVEREERVIHVVAGQLRDLSPLLGDLDTSSRDFH